MIKVCLVFEENCFLPNCFLEWLHHLTFPPAVNERLSVFASLPAFSIIALKKNL